METKTREAEKMREAETKRYVVRRVAILDRLRQILIEDLKVQRAPQEIDPDAPLFGTGLRLDSVDAVELWVRLDMVFGLQPPEDPGIRLGASRTLNRLVDVILGAEKSHG